MTLLYNIGLRSVLKHCSRKPKICFCPAVKQKEVLALIGSDIKLHDGSSRGVTWYSAKRSDYTRHLAGEGDWFEATAEFLLVRNINYNLQGKVVTWPIKCTRSNRLYSVDDTIHTSRGD